MKESQKDFHKETVNKFSNKFLDEALKKFQDKLLTGGISDIFFLENFPKKCEIISK